MTVLSSAIRDRKRSRTRRLAAAQLRRELGSYRTPSERAELAAIFARCGDEAGQGLK